MRDTVLPWRELLAHPASGYHVAQIYQDDLFLTETVKIFIGEGLQAGDGIIIIATVPRRQAFLRQLYTEGFDLDRAMQSGQLKLLDTETTLSKITRDGMPDWNAFRDTIGVIVREMGLHYPSVRIYGEAVDFLWRQGEHEATMRLEEFWNELAKLYPFSLLCAYFMDCFSEENYDGDLQRICKHHTHFIPINDYDQFERVVNDATHDVLGNTLNNKIYALSSADRSSTNMPFAQATILWLQENMPIAAKKVLTRVRTWYKFSE